MKQHSSDLISVSKESSRLEDVHRVERVCWDSLEVRNSQRSWHHPTRTLKVKSAKASSLSIGGDARSPMFVESNIVQDLKKFFYFIKIHLLMKTT